MLVIAINMWHILCKDSYCKFFMQNCNNFDTNMHQKITDLLQECINFVRISHRSGNESIIILQPNHIIYAANW